MKLPHESLGGTVIAGLALTAVLIGLVRLLVSA